MNPTAHWHCPETIDPFLRAFRAEAAARYERMQAVRRRAELPRPAGLHLLCLLVSAQTSVASRRGEL